MEEDLILGETDDKDHALEVIESQLTIITTVQDLDNDLYDECQTDKIKVITRALKIIHKIQATLLKDF